MAEEESSPPPSPPQYLEVNCKITGKSWRFAAGTDAGFAVALINRKLKGSVPVATHIEAAKDGEEPIAFGPNAVLSHFGEGWKLHTVTFPSGKFNKPHLI
ncbi:hypothetical protein SESBI_35137 [Sesbania bispinosa]|nr:hypothetical protein SESBI_35137 [Sesbania bispinosa]